MLQPRLVIGWRTAEIERNYDQAANAELTLFRDDGRKPSDQPLTKAASKRRQYHANIEHYRETARKRMKKQNDKRAAMRRAVREALGHKEIEKLNTDFRTPTTIANESHSHA